MKIKIGNKNYDSEIEPIAIYLDEKDFKKMDLKLEENQVGLYYCDAPDDFPKNKLEDFQLGIERIY